MLRQSTSTALFFQSYRKLLSFLNSGLTFFIFLLQKPSVFLPLTLHCFDHCVRVYRVSRRALVPFSCCHARPWVPDCPRFEGSFDGSFVSYQTTKFVFVSRKNEKLQLHVAPIACPRELQGATVCGSASKCHLSLPGL